MRSINKVILIGNLTRNPEMRETPSNQKVVTFGLATNREWVTKTGERKNSAEFHECVAWAKLAEICATHLKKGALIYVEGYLKTRSWDSPEGEKKFKTEIVMQDMIMLEKREEKGEDDMTTNATEKTIIQEKTLKEKEPESQTTEPAEAPTEEEAGIDIDADLGL